MDKVTEMFATVAALLVGVALLAVFLSRNSNTAGVIQAFFSGFGNSLAVATGPVTGASITPDLSYPTSGFNGLQIPNIR